MTHDDSRTAAHALGPAAVVPLRIVPVFGPKALEVYPRIGQLHIVVDDAPWHWMDPNHQPLDRASVSFTLPAP